MNWLDIGTLDDIPTQGARVLSTAQGDIAVFRTGLDELFAVEDRCPHRGGPLSQGIVFEKRVACPLHDWVIDLEQGCATGPDRGCARTYPVRLEGGRVYLGLAQTDRPGQPAMAGAA
jgi:nitrite reductase (NADH) small subunit